jgi:excisionase family DNA binding protein
LVTTGRSRPTGPKFARCIRRLPTPLAAQDAHVPSSRDTSAAASLPDAPRRSGVPLRERYKDRFPDTKRPPGPSAKITQGARPLHWEPTTKPNTPNTHHHTDLPVPPEFLETLARVLAAALIPPPRPPEPIEVEDTPDFLTAAQLAQRLGVSRETVRRLAIAGTLPHTVICRGTRKTTRRYPRRFAEEFAASGLETADLAAFAATWRARVTAPAP